MTDNQKAFLAWMESLRRKSEDRGGEWSAPPVSLATEMLCISLQREAQEWLERAIDRGRV